MATSFRLPSNATKKVLVDKYTELLAAYEAKAAESERHKHALSAAERHATAGALEVADDASVPGVIASVGKLRNTVLETLNGLTGELGAKAEQLEQLDVAIVAKEKRLAELHDIEVAADTFQLLMAAYSEQRRETADDAAARQSALEAEYAERKAELEAEHKRLSESLAETRDAKRREWDLLRQQEKEQTDAVKKERDRETADYEYKRDRERRIEEDAYQTQSADMKRELAEKVRTTEADLAAREAAVAEGEAELAALRAEVEAFGTTLERERKAAAEGAEARVRVELEQQLEVATVERSWERKMMQQNIEQLGKIIDQQKVEEAALRKELAKAQGQVQTIAERALEGSRPATISLDGVSKLMGREGRSGERSAE